jgi:hypothetical protein
MLRISSWLQAFSCPDILPAFDLATLLKLKTQAPYNNIVPCGRKSKRVTAQSAWDKLPTVWGGIHLTVVWRASDVRHYRKHYGSL